MKSCRRMPRHAATVFPHGKKDPLGETLRAMEGIPKDKVFADGYANFQRDMVYGDKPDFSTAMGTLSMLGGHLKKLRVRPGFR